MNECPRSYVAARREDRLLPVRNGVTEPGLSPHTEAPSLLVSRTQSAWRYRTRYRTRSVSAHLSRPALARPRTLRTTAERLRAPGRAIRRHALHRVMRWERSALFARDRGARETGDIQRTGALVCGDKPGSVSAPSPLASTPCATRARGSPVRDVTEPGSPSHTGCCSRRPATGSRSRTASNDERA